MLQILPLKSEVVNEKTTPQGGNWLYHYCIDWSIDLKETWLSLEINNSSQYISTKFGGATKTYNIKQEFIYHHTPEQSGHVESFHKNLKKEHIHRITLNHSKIQR